MNAIAASLPAAPMPAPSRLSTLRPGDVALVLGVDAPGAGTAVALARRLLELGFVAGERLEVLAEAYPGRDPFVVRIGQTTLALRRREAEIVRVESLPARDGR